MYTGFNLHIDKNAEIFNDTNSYDYFLEVGNTHLNEQKADYKRKLKKYVAEREIDGTKIQDEWFPMVEADIFLSHSGKDKDLTCALAGWIYTHFGLRCFIDSNVWGYAEELLDELNARLSDRRSWEGGGYLYNYESSNQVSQHVNSMLSIALQKMIDKVEAVILINTGNSIQVCDDSHMNKTYSPWIYSELICTQIVRKKPLLAYRDYASYIILEHKEDIASSSRLQLAMQFAISYTVPLNHLKLLGEDDLKKWENLYSSDELEYEYPLDALYSFIYPGAVEDAKGISETLDRDELDALKRAYTVRGQNSGEETGAVWRKILNKYILPCQGCNRNGRFFYE